mmetsp:Transcript_11010/g.30908  ORF Transcript_11010/g.30908 Transcript_11010/m.30908 type:complete len:223 (-) Transcript_11010:113-781(-)
MELAAQPHVPGDEPLHGRQYQIMHDGAGVADVGGAHADGIGGIELLQVVGKVAGELSAGRVGAVDQNDEAAAADGVGLHQHLEEVRKGPEFLSRGVAGKVAMAPAFEQDAPAGRVGLGHELEDSHLGHVHHLILQGPAQREGLVAGGIAEQILAQIPVVREPGGRPGRVVLLAVEELELAPIADLGGTAQPGQVVHLRGRRGEGGQVSLEGREAHLVARRQR